MSPDPASLAQVLALAEDRLARQAGLVVLGIAGAQGSGKTTLARALAQSLKGKGLAVASLSLDDLYLTRAERVQLARTVHPLLATRGVPGTHDLVLGLSVIAALERGEAVALPRFDKAVDDRAPPEQWPQAPAHCRVLVLEGWCMGAAAQSDAALVQPVNALERDEDPDGRWRRHANACLAGDYQHLFARVDALAFLAAPSFAVVQGWRTQQERDLGAGHGVMDDAQIARFIQCYQRITEAMLAELPGRADLTLRLDEARRLPA